MAMFCLENLFLVVAVAVIVTVRGYGLGEKRSRSHGPNDELVFDCSDKDDGFYADTMRACHQYYHCYMGMKSTYHCPPGSLFDETTESCNKEDYVQCGQIPLEIRSESHGAEDWLVFNCEGRPNGFYGDVNRGCHQYYQCVDGKKITHFCPQNYLFDFKSQACAPKETVKCGKITKRTQSHGQENWLDFKCEDRPNGFYGDVNRACHQYYQCVDGRKITHFCPVNYLFDFKSQACAPKETVRCGKVTKRTQSHGQENWLVFKCDDRPNGFYGDVNRGCHQYYQCVDGQKVTHVCRPGYLFDSKSEACAPESKVLCGKPGRKKMKSHHREEDDLDELERVLENLAREVEREQKRGR